MSKVNFISHYGSDVSIGKIASICYGDAFPSNDKALKVLNTCIKKEHDSVLEFAGACFLIECPIYVARQIMRHRMFYYMEKSLRYTKPTEDNKEYLELINAGVKKELARAVLPLRTETAFYMQGNLRSYKNFLKQRLSKQAQAETKEIAKDILEVLCGIFPYCFY